MARPSSLTEIVVSKLEHAIMDGANVTEACQVAGISRETYYKGLKENIEFADRMTDAEEYPSKVAKKNLIEKIKRKDIETSKWWLERKNKKEFSLRIEQTGADGQPLLINDLHATANSSVGAGGVSGKTKTSTPNSPTT